MEGVVALFIPIVLFVSIAWVIVSLVNRKSLNKERLSLIEKGGDPQLLDTLKNKSFFESNTLKYGLVAIGVSFGCLLGSFLDQNELLASSEVGYFCSIFFFTGIALIVSYYLNKNENKD